MFSHTVEIRARYPECDPQGVVHHSVYPVWFEIARTEHLRSSGQAYSRLERDGVILVVSELSLKYFKPVLYDECVEVTSIVTKAAGVRIVHRYEVKRDGELCCEGASTLACIDAEGKLARLPDFLWLETERTKG